jgi:hypothetical protein
MIAIVGGIVTCIEGLRVWALLDGREVLLLYETAYPKVR